MAASESGAASSPVIAAALTREAAAGLQVLEALRGRIQHQIRYPALARARGWKGTVLLVARLDPRGRLQELVVEKSSGYAVLDTEATAVVRRVIPIENPLGLPLSIEIPSMYELKEK
jgi:protein TonB